LNPGDLVIDIGSNDGTSLGFYPENLKLVGVDPTGNKFKKYYKPHVELISDFFTSSLVNNVYGDKKAKVVTSFSMFYDLDEPVSFAKEVSSVLDKNEGVWIFEQSYMPLMLERNSYDTICHEHLEYYGLKQIAFIAEKAGLKLIDVELNDVNGGSFSVVAAPLNSDRKPNSEKINSMLAAEEKAGLQTLEPYQSFFERVKENKAKLIDFIQAANRSGKRVCGLGASTKGNVVLQYCGFTEHDIQVVADVNPDKFGTYTPGSCIPIIDERRVLAEKPDYLLVLPWHFREFFVTNPAFKNTNLLFPLPNIEIVAVK
jgi:NDP-4-keto-2,6-dideoxyhexose 3-C-methyltransferase